MKKAKKHVKPSVSIVIRLGQNGGSYVLAKAFSKVYALSDSAEDNSIKKLNHWKKGEVVVQVEQYDVEEQPASGSAGTKPGLINKEFCLSRTRCKNWLAECGVNQAVPCYKRHRSVYLATNIREPFGFKMAVPQARMQPHQQQRTALGGSKFRYKLPPGLKQDIDNNLDPAGVGLAAGS